MKNKILFFVHFVFVIAAPAQTTNRWAHGLSGKWELGTNWTINLPPTNNSVVFITNASSKTVTIDATTAMSNAVNNCMTITNLTVSAPAGSVNTLLLSDSGTNVLRVSGNCSVGAGGSMVISDAVVFVKQGPGLQSFFDNGQVWLTTANSRLLTTNAFSTLIGNSLPATLTISNGVMLAETLSVGQNSGGAGTLTIAGGVCQVIQDMQLGPSSGIGTIWVTGGQFLYDGTIVSSSGRRADYHFKWNITDCADHRRSA